MWTKARIGSSEQYKNPVVCDKTVDYADAAIINAFYNKTFQWFSQSIRCLARISPYFSLFYVAEYNVIRYIFHSIRVQLLFINISTTARTS